MFKKSSNSLLNTYNKRYFKLQGLKLYYGDSETIKVKSYIDLRNVIAITEEVDKEKLEFTITTETRSYDIKASLYREAQIWLRVLEVYVAKAGNDNFNKEYNPSITLLKALNVVFTHLERNGYFIFICCFNISSFCLWLF